MTVVVGEPVERVAAELAGGMALAKCRQCGCMRDALVGVQAALAATRPAGAGALAGQIEAALQDLQPLKYACLGCDVCIAAVASNLFGQAFPEAGASLSLACTFEVSPERWPVVPGEYLLPGSPNAPVAVSTLGSLDLPEQVAGLKPGGLAIIGKTETENIGLDKIIKNTVANPALRYLVLAGRDAEGHYPGQTLLALARHGVDEKLRVIGSRGKRPALRNVTRDEIEAFRRQVQIVDLIGCEDAAEIAAKVAELAGESAAGGELCSDPACACHAAASVTAVSFSIPLTMALPLAPAPASCGCDGACEETTASQAAGVPVIQAQAPKNIELDKAGYFVVIVQRDRGLIVTEHYTYDNTLTGVIEGKDARSIYWTAIENAWVGQVSHAAYLGKELARAELALRAGGPYTQDGA